MNDAKPKILMVDDDTNVLMMLHALLGQQFDLRVARSGREALRLARSDVPDTVLLDVEMPDLDGYETCRRFKADPLLADIPVVFLTSHSTEDDEVRGLTAGASDFIVKPPRGPAVAARVDNLVRMKRMSERIRADALTDGLTSLANRTHFDRMLAQEWLRALRTARPLALVMADVDHFKAYNDHYGHLGGDGCLRAVAQAMRGALHRPADLVARYGGEEFVLLLPDTDAAGARQVAEQVRLAVRGAALPHAASPVAAHVTLSLGVSVVDESCAGWVPWSLDSGFMPDEPMLQARDLVLAADRALYAAKSHGRDAAWYLGVDDRDAPALACACARDDAALERAPATATNPAAALG